MNVRELPCSKCGKATTSTGDPYFMGRAPVRFPVTYRCGCGTHMTLSAHEFNRLPQLAPEEYEHRLPEERIDTPSKSVSQRFIPVKQAKPGLGALVEAPPLKDVKLPMFKEK